MLVVEMSSTGPEILWRIEEPERKECLVVRLREGMGAEIEGLLLGFLVVNARARDMVLVFLKSNILCDDGVCSPGTCDMVFVSFEDRGSLLTKDAII
jgi:hypothetical protein